MMMIMMVYNYDGCDDDNGGDDDDNGDDDA